MFHIYSWSMTLVISVLVKLGQCRLLFFSGIFFFLQKAAIHTVKETEIFFNLGKYNIILVETQKNIFQLTHDCAKLTSSLENSETKTSRDLKSIQKKSSFVATDFQKCFRTVFIVHKSFISKWKMVFMVLLILKETFSYSTNMLIR